MTRYHPIYVRRSDGKAETGQGERNEPTPDQLNDRPDANGVSDYYRPIAEDEPKHLDWRRKLGGMLWLRKSVILAHLPTNFRLFEHIKSRAHDGDPSTRRASKNHAGGGHDRQDAYLYGHPLGRKKRYRSPADFFPHLLWLATDKDGNRDNCGCKLCCPEEVQEEKAAASRAAIKDGQSPGSQSQAGTPAQSPAAPRPGHKHPSVVIPTTNSSSKHRNASAQAKQPAPHPAPAQSAAPPPPHPPQSLQQPRYTRLPALPFRDFQVDMQWNTLLFRPGEVVWHSRGDAWGLGVVVRRYMIETQDIRERHYVIQQLSNPMDPLRPVHHSEERLLRPWLAWSPPPLTNEILANRPDVTFHNVDWQAVLNGQFGQGNAEVDGSILAAKAIDVSFTLLHLLNTTNNAQAEARHWGGMFLGAEKIWIGEPVRVRLDAPVQLPVLVITDIIEQVELGRPNPRSNVIVRGDLYSLGTEQANSEIPSFGHLPHRMAQDLMIRNQFSFPLNRVSVANLVKQQLLLPLGSIRGRWYESNVLLPMIQPEAEFIEARRRGTVDETDPWLNGRGDSSGKHPVVNLRAPERRDALGRAVPDNTRIHDGLEAMSPDELAALTGAVMPPIQAQAQQQVQGQAPASFDAAGFGGMDVDVGEFMNLESDFPGGGANSSMGWP